jgi:tellurite resistance protein TerC
MFAMDSVPAALSVSRREFIVYSSNVFAILGLRSLYIVLAKTLVELAYLHYGLAAVLAFAGLKMLFASWVEIPPLMSVGIIVGIVGVAVWASLRAQTPYAQSKLREDG